MLDVATDSVHVDGLSILREFVTIAEESALVAWIGATPRAPGAERNRVLRYGPGVPGTGYISGQVARDIPLELEMLCDRLVATWRVTKKPNALTVNEYHPGQGLLLHRDRERCGDTVSILSLAGDSSMDFHHRLHGRTSMPLARRSLVQLSGPSLREWQHAVPPVTTLRYSIVFRYGTTFS